MYLLKCLQELKEYKNKTYYHKHDFLIFLILLRFIKRLYKINCIVFLIQITEKH